MQMNRKSNLFVLFVALVAMLASVQAHPMLEEPRTSAKEVRPDPLDAAGSDELPMLHNNDFDTIMMDSFDHHPAESMQYQNFEQFYEPQREMENAEYKMDESQFLKGTQVRAPQPLTAEEARTRQDVYYLDPAHERQKQQKLKKGSVKPQQRTNQWDQFDYDLYSVKPENQKN